MKHNTTVSVRQAHKLNTHSHLFLSRGGRARLLLAILALAAIFSATFGNWESGRVAAVAPASPIIALTGSNTLLRFNADAPGTILGTVAVTGLAAGDTLVGIDFRPATGQLFGLGVNGATARLYIIVPSTGAATQLGGSISLPQSAGVAGAETDFGFDFNPTVDRIRVMANNRDNIRLNPNTGGVAGVDTALNPGTPVVVGAAYDRNFDGATVTTLYGIDASTDQLVTIGGLNSSPSPNAGGVFVIGSLGVDTDNRVGFDSVGDAPSLAYASLTVGGTSGLYSVSLATGAVSLIGAIGDGTTSIVGIAIPPGPPSVVSDQTPGSVLFYNLYSSGATNSITQNTRVAITNTNPTQSTVVHLFFVDGTSCAVADSFICLTPNQTATFLMSDLDPGTTGYIVAVASDQTGCPTNFNFLIGDAYVKLSTGHAANLAAEAFHALSGNAPLCGASSSTAALNFDGVIYDRAPRVLAVDNIPSRADGNDTLLVVNRIGGNLATGAATLGTLFGILYDDSETALSFAVAGACQLRGSLSNSFLRTTPRIETFIPAGRSGWMKLYSTQADIGLLGAVINFNATAGAQANAFNQGHNLHKLRLSTTNTLTIPIFPPGC